MKHPLIIGVAGGSGSGKTTVVNKLRAACPDLLTIFHHDSFYHDASYVDQHLNGNWDHPDSLDNRLFAAQAAQLAAGNPVESPVYDFTTYSRRRDSAHRIEPKPVIIVEGILVLALPELNETLNLRVFIDTPQEVRYERRLRRDMAERGRSTESVLLQHQQTVWPMHDSFVEPSKATAHLVIPWIGDNSAAINTLAAAIRQYSKV